MNHFYSFYRKVLILYFWFIINTFNSVITFVEMS
jgi:hypothetical protein